MRTTIIIFLMLALIDSIRLARADETHDIYMKSGAIGIPDVTTITIDSKFLQQKREISVSLPISYVESGDRHQYPVIYVLDAELMFHTISGLIHYQGMNSQMPEAIVIGINNYAGTRRDITPTPLNSKGEPLWFGGKQDDYLNFIQKELSPIIEQRFHAADYRVVIGLSPSGQFALHSLWNAPDLFNAHIALNTADFTAVGYEGNSAFHKIIKMLKENKHKKGHLYISMPKSGGGSNPKILAGYEKFKTDYNKLDNNAFRYKQELIDFNSYAAVIPAATSALNFIFPPKLWDPSYRQFLSDKSGQTLANIKNYYNNLSNEYGFEARPKGERYYNQNRLKRIGYLFLAQNKIDESIDIFEYWRSLYPNAANAYDSLADAYLKKGDLVNEKKHREQARALADKNLDFRRSLF